MEHGGGPRGRHRPGRPLEDDRPPPLRACPCSRSCSCPATGAARWGRWPSLSPWPRHWSRIRCGCSSARRTSSRGRSACARAKRRSAGIAAANLHLAAEWLWTYWTPGLVVLALARPRPRRRAPARARRAALLLALLTAGPTIAFVAVSGIWYPRYLLFTTIPLLPLSAWGLVGLADARAAARPPWRRSAAAAVAAGLLVLVLVPALRFDLALWTDPTRAPFPALDRFQYVTGWPSGYGSRDSVEFLRAERKRNVGRARRGDAGTLHDGERRPPAVGERSGGRGALRRSRRGAAGGRARAAPSTSSSPSRKAFAFPSTGRAS